MTSPLRNVAIAVTVLALCLIQARSASASLVLFDGTFNNGDWVHSVLVATNATYTVNQSPTGGFPGSYQSGKHFLGPTVPNYIEVAHVFSAGGSYDPSTMGAIEQVNVNYDFIVTNVINAGPLVGHGLLLEQSGDFFLYRLADAAYGDGWTAFSASGLQATDFIAAQSGPSHPDFSTGGAPIQFGYFTLNGTPPSGSGAAELDWGIDNYSVTAISVVPEPSSLFVSSMLATGIVVGRLRQRRKQSA